MILINNDIKLKELIPVIQESINVGLDIEGSGLDPYTSKVLLVQLSINNEEYVINAGRVSNKTLRYLFRVLQETGALVIGHNIKYDMKMVYHHYGVLLTNVFDTLLAESFQKLGVGKKYPSYEDTVRKYFNVELNKDVREEFIGKEDFDFTEQQYQYGAEDVKYLIPLKEKLQGLLDQNQSEKMWTLEKRVEPVVTMMEYQGILLDVTEWRRLAQKSEDKANEYYGHINAYLSSKIDTIAPNYSNAYELAEQLNIPITTKREQGELEKIVTRDEILAKIIPMINFNSPKQMLTVLNGLGIDTDSSSQKELQKYQGHKFIDLLFKYREYFKAGHAFGDEFVSKINTMSGRIHGSFDQQGTATGRFSSSDPNLQNIKADEEYRACFIARPNYKFFTADYSQIELRILAEVSREPLMIEAFQNGEDLHRLTASIIFDKSLKSVTPAERGRAKNVNFAVVYGTTEYGLRYNFGWPLEVGREYLDKYFKRYKTLKNFIDVVGREVIARKYSTTQLGRRRYFTLPQKLTKYDIRLINKVKRQGINHIIQGGSADMIKMFLCNLFYDNPFDDDIYHPELFRTLITVHDEVDGEFHEDIADDAEEFIKASMKSASEYFLKDVPVDYHVEIDTCWRK